LGYKVIARMLETETSESIETGLELHGQRSGVYVGKTCPTLRAADGGWAARFLAFFAASSLIRFENESSPSPTAANACRWAVLCQTWMI